MSRSSVTALAVVVPLLLLVSCGTEAPDPARGAASPAGGLPDAGWTRLQDVPLSPREGTVTEHLTTDDGVDLAVAVGGYTGPPCPPNADCAIPEDAMARDGAVLDVGSGTWREIADAPRAVSAYSSSAALGDTLYVLTDGHLLAWDAGEGRWSEIEAPASPRWYSLVADDLATPARLLLVSGSDEAGVRPDMALDPADSSWSRLPADPLTPSFDRQVVATPAGLVLTAKPIGPDGGPEDPALVRAAVLDRDATTWRTIPSGGDQLGGWAWAWTGHRAVDATPGGADGGQVNGYGRTIPYGGALDPASGEWHPLHGTPDAFTGGWSIDAVGRRVHAVQGWIYDDGVAGRGSSWTRTPVPDGAPDEPGPAVWVDDALVVVGGADWDEPGAAVEDVWSVGTWVLRVD